METVHKIPRKKATCLFSTVLHSDFLGTLDTFPLRQHNHPPLNISLRPTAIFEPHFSILKRLGLPYEAPDP
jgi:hypothetical protein